MNSSLHFYSFPAIQVVKGSSKLLVLAVGEHTLEGSDQH
jgi:hypothetical protein